MANLNDNSSLIHDCMKFYRNFLRAIESYIMFGHDLAAFLASVRASYDIWLREGGIAKLTYASVQGTLAGAISEVGRV